MLENLPVPEWWQRASEMLASRELLEIAALQLLLIAAAFILAGAIRLATRGLTDSLAERLEPYLRTWRRAVHLGTLVTPACAWLLLVVAERLAERFGVDTK